MINLGIFCLNAELKQKRKLTIFSQRAAKMSELNPCYRRKRLWQFTEKQIAQDKNKSTVVFLSCCLIAIPGIAALPCEECFFSIPNENFNYIHAFIPINAAFWSVFADYFYAADSKGSIKKLGFDVHTIDRYNAFVSITYFVVQLLLAEKYWQISSLAAIFGSFLYSRNSPSAEVWFVRHTIWVSVFKTIVQR